MANHNSRIQFALYHLCSLFIYQKPWFFPNYFCKFSTGFVLSKLHTINTSNYHNIPYCIVENNPQNGLKQIKYQEV